VRLAFISSTPMSVRGGSGTFVGISVLQRALEEQGHQIDLISPDSGRMPFGHAAQRIGFNVRVGRRLARLGHEPDLIVGFDLDGCLLRHNAPFVASIKGVLAEELTFERGIVRFSLWLQSRFERLNVRRAPLVLTTSEYARRRIAANYGVMTTKIAVVPEPIDLGGWRTALAAAGPRRDWTPTILTVCHLYPRKSVDVLLRAMTLVRATIPDARLRIVGIGPELDRLIGLRDELGLTAGVDFLRHIPFEQLVLEYRDAALFCLPSRQEGFGIVLLEALAAGRAVVASRATAIPEVMPDGTAGSLVAPGDSGALAATLIELLSQPERADALGANGARHVEAFDAPRVATRFMGTVAGKRHRRPGTS
jgi:glycosyltransferase involved in cell wall biosynthesis